MSIRVTAYPLLRSSEPTFVSPIYGAPAFLQSMSRYLTASKVGLLALISLYGDSVVPTAAIVPLLSFVVPFLLPQALARGSPSCKNGKFSADSLSDVQEATIGHASGIPGRTLWDLFLKKLWEINSFDQLHVFFSSLSLLLANSLDEEQKVTDEERMSVTSRLRFSRSSPFGVFLRRAQLEFTRLQWHDSITLWNRFVLYRNPTLSAWKRRNQGHGKASFDVNLGEPRIDGQEGFRLILYRDIMEAGHGQVGNSTEDIEKLLEFQRDRMQGSNLQVRFHTYIANISILATGIRVTEDMQRRLTKMIGAETNIPALSHYVKLV